MSENEPNGGSTAENEALGQIAAELKQLNDRFEPVPWYKIETGRPVGYGLVGLVFLILGASASSQPAAGFLLITGAIFFVAQAIAGSRLKK